MKQNGNPRNKSKPSISTSFWQGNNRERIVSSINVSEKNGLPHAKNETDPLFYITHKNQCKIDKIPKYKTKNYKISRRKHSWKASGYWYNQGYFDYNTKDSAPKTKVNILYSWKEKKILNSKENNLQNEVATYN